MQTIESFVGIESQGSAHETDDQIGPCRDTVHMQARTEDHRGPATRTAGVMQRRKKVWAALGAVGPSLGFLLGGPQLGAAGVPS